MKRLNDSMKRVVYYFYDFCILSSIVYLLFCKEICYPFSSSICCWCVISILLEKIYFMCNISGFVYVYVSKWLEVLLWVAKFFLIKDSEFSVLCPACKMCCADGVIGFL